MDFYGSRRLRTLAVGIATAVLVDVPPLEISAHLDRALYDTNARMSVGEPPAELLLVELDDPAWLSSLASLAYRHRAELLVSTLPRPPTLPQLELLGPTALSVGSSAMLRPTPWREGGHLSLALDTDGVLRFDRPLLEDIPPLPSLGLAAAQRLLGAGTIERGSRTVVAAAPYRFSTDPSGRRWLRFYDAAGIATSTPHEIAAHPNVLAGRVVIAGAGEQVYPTPVGRLSAREVVAESLIGYWHNDAIAVGWPGALLAWCLLGVAWGTAWRLRPATTAQSAITCVSIAFAVLLCSQVVAFRWLSLWLPVAAPLLATLAALAYWVSRHAALPTPAVATTQPPSASAPTKPAASPAAPIDAERDAPVSEPLPAAPDGGPPRASPVWSGGEAATVDAGEHAATAPTLPMLGRYELMQYIGHGAMGSVYLARDTTINRSVAIKAIDLATEFDIDEIPAAGERFLREAETAGRLSHPNIVTIFDAGRVGGTAYIAMEYLTGTRLSERASPEALLPAALALELVARAAEALAYAHGHNVVHRDIKPANIMYDSGSDTLKITDFGIARWIDVSRTRTGIVLGTPSFMSPEQLEGKNVNGHTDLFALGITLYQLLTGLLPFRGTSMTQLMFVIANEPHAPLAAARPDLPPGLGAIIDRALAKAPSDRFASGEEMAQELRAAAAGLA